jgi:hypothetical protein
MIPFESCGLKPAATSGLDSNATLAFVLPGIVPVYEKYWEGCSNMSPEKIQEARNEATLASERKTREENDKLKKRQQTKLASF